MPEVRKVLAFHLNTKNDPSLAVRSIYGHQLPHLIVMDQNWVKQNLSRIFPPNENDRSLCLAAWNTYLRGWGVYKNVFSALYNEYEKAIDRLSNEIDENDQRLAEHMIRAYAFGYLPLEDGHGLLQRFYAKATDRLCAHVLWQIGYSLHETKEQVHPIILERFQALWNQRLSIARSNPEAHIKEMVAFGNLFYSEKFDDAWALTELKNALEISNGVSRHFSLYSDLVH